MEVTRSRSLGCVLEPLVDWPHSNTQGRDRGQDGDHVGSDQECRYWPRNHFCHYSGADRV